jgi:hypothetical protein
MRIPSLTGPGDSFPQFPIYDRTICQWHAANDEFVWSTLMIETLPTSPQSEPPNEYMIGISQEVRNAIEDATQDEVDIISAAKDGNRQDSINRSRLSEELAEAGIDTLEFKLSDFAQATEIPPAPVDDPQWTPWLSHMASSNIYGQLILMYTRVEAFQDGMELLSLHCKREISRLDQGKQQLLARVQQVREAMNVLKKRHEETKKSHQEHAALNKEISEGLKIAQVKQFVDRENRSPHLGSSPYILPLL